MGHLMRDDRYTATNAKWSYSRPFVILLPYASLNNYRLLTSKGKDS